MATARTRRLRWSAPLLAAAVVAVLAAIPGLSAADTPTLPPVAAQQLIVKVQQANVSAFSGTLDLSTNLGIPNLSALAGAAGGGGHGGQGFTPTDLLSGSHRALVWFSAPDSARVALLQDMAETDVVHNGSNVWIWDSTTKKVTHYTLAAHSGAKASATPDPSEQVQTPQQVADDLLSHIDPSTAVSVTSPVAVAGQKAYQLVLSPRAAESTVDHVVISVDSVTGMALQVQMFAKGQKAAAVKLGFSSIKYSKPAASNFSFAPPPGSTVTNKTMGGSSTPDPAQADTTKHQPPTDQAATGQPTTVGHDWTTVAILHNVQIPKEVGDFLKAASSVSGRFGSGKVIQTSLVNILVLDDGRVAVGAVNVAALEAAVASAP
jgi:outer membrane lipoprotein-sorting protein